MTDISSGTTTSVPTPSLKGTVSTNDDPLRCEKCSDLLPLETLRSLAYPCCGKMFCPSCQKKQMKKNSRSCPAACGMVPSMSASNRLLKKNAKKGRPWAQHFLARLFQRGLGGMAQSDFEAVRWLRKAVSNGHPESMLHLGRMLLEGSGCEQDLVMAAEYVEIAMKAHVEFFTEDALKVLARIGEQYFELGNPTKAISMLSPLAESGHTAAKHKLSFVYCEVHDYPNALKWLEEAILDMESQNNDELCCLAANSAHEAVRLAMYQGDYTRAKFWLMMTNKRLRIVLADCYGDPKDVVQMISVARNGLREIRNACGGCGAPLHGAMRKKCGGCKTYCYCNRDCQTAHWNRSKDGHREECKGVMELKEKMKDARHKKSMSDEE